MDFITDGVSESLFGNGDSSTKDNETQNDNPDGPQTLDTSFGGSDQSSSAHAKSLEENGQNGAGGASLETCKTSSAFSIFVPTIQMAWADDLWRMTQLHGSRYSSFPLLARSFDLYGIWRKRYNLPPNAEGGVCKRPSDWELDREIIPFDLLKDLLTKLTNDAIFAMEKARFTALNDTYIPADIKQDAPTIHDLPLERQHVVKQSLLNSIPHPGLLPPEFWMRWPNEEDKEKAPTIDTTGLDTFIRLARALAALGIPTYLHGPIAGQGLGNETHNSGFEAAIWTDLGREPMHDWNIKQRILKINYFNMKTYLSTPQHTMRYWNLAFMQKLWSRAEFQLSSQQMVTTTEEDWPKFEPGGPRVVWTDSVQVEPKPFGLQIDFWSNEELRHGPKTFQEILNGYFSRQGRTQNLCHFPNFLHIRCGGGRGRSRQQVQSSFILNAVSLEDSMENTLGFSQLSCVYKLKIVWRQSSELEDNDLHDEPRSDDCKLYDSEGYQALLRFAQDPEQLHDAEDEDLWGDDQDWTLETSPIDYSFVVIYYRVGSELNEEDFQKDWESDPRVEKMYPERATAMQGKSVGGTSGSLPVRTR